MLAALDRLVAAGVDDQTFRERADRVVRPALGLDVVAWSTTDPATGLLTSCHVVGVPYDADRERSVFRYEYEEDGEVGARYTDLARADVPAAVLSLTTAGNPAASARYRELLEPLGIVDELRVALVAGGVLWGTLTAYRQGDRGRFTERELRAAAAAGPTLALGLRRGLLHRACADPLGATVVPEPPGTVILDGGGVVVATTAAAEQWLDAIGERGRLPSVIMAVAAAARAGGYAPALEAVVAARDGGWVAVHASRAKGQDEDHVALVLERPRPAVLADHLATVHGLTERERQVTGLLLQGLANKEVASRLHTSPYTVNDHLKSIFAKFGVSSRGQLAALLLDTQFLPRMHAGRAPGPYGWFLEPSPLPSPSPSPTPSPTA